MIFKYHWLNIGTGRRGISDFYCAALCNLLVFLNRCNAQDPGVWQYWYEGE
jgi:hypothetical protein